MSFKCDEDLLLEEMDEPEKFRQYYTEAKTLCRYFGSALRAAIDQDKEEDGYLASQGDMGFFSIRLRLIFLCRYQQRQCPFDIQVSGE